MWDPSAADDALWAELHRHFSVPELVELGYFVGITLGQQRWIKTLDLQHFDIETSSAAGVRDATPGA